MAEIMVEYKKITLGQYKDIAFAVTIRKIAERFYGFHENHGKNIGDIQAANQGLILESKGEFAKNQRKENS